MSTSRRQPIDPRVHALRTLAELLVRHRSSGTDDDPTDTPRVTGADDTESPPLRKAA